MIRTFKNKRLRKLYTDDDGRGLPPDQIDRITNRLATIDVAKTIDDIDIVGFGLHQLKGEYKGFWAVKITGNWRIIFQFKDGDAYDLDHIDYH